MRIDSTDKQDKQDTPFLLSLERFDKYNNTSIQSKHYIQTTWRTSPQVAATAIFAATTLVELAQEET